MDCCHNIFIHTTNSQFSFWDARFITATGIIIGLITFMLERRSAKISKLKRIRESWFLTIIVQPNLLGIDNFYEDVIKNIKTSISTLKSNSNLQHNDYIVLESSEIVKFTEMRRQFMNNFVFLVRGHSKDLSTDLNEIINKLNDQYSNVLDSIDNNPAIDLNDVENNIWENKGFLIEELFKSLKRG